MLWRPTLTEGVVTGGTVELEDVTIPYALVLPANVTLELTGTNTVNGPISAAGDLTVVGPGSLNIVTDKLAGISATGSVTVESGTVDVNMGSPEPTAAVCPFTDVDADAYYRKAVLWATEKGITKGTSATTFSPKDICTRAQVVTLQWRTAGSPAATAANPFTDVGSGLYYTDAVLWAVSGKITEGTTATTFSPAQTCTRAQIVAFLWRQLGK